MFEAITEYKTRADRKLMQKIQAILFVSEGAVSIDDLCQSLGEDYEDIEMSLADLDDYLCEENSALEIREVADGFQLFTKDEYYEACESYILDQDRRKLSGSAIEVLSIVAYTQPVTRSQISEIRGVNSDPWNVDDSRLINNAHCGTAHPPNRDDNKDGENAQVHRGSHEHER